MQGTTRGHILGHHNRRICDDMRSLYIITLALDFLWVVIRCEERIPSSILIGFLVKAPGWNWHG